MKIEQIEEKVITTVEEVEELPVEEATEEIEVSDALAAAIGKQTPTIRPGAFQFGHPFKLNGHTFMVAGNDANTLVLKLVGVQGRKQTRKEKTKARKANQKAAKQQRLLIAQTS